MRLTSQGLYQSLSFPFVSEVVRMASALRKKSFFASVQLQVNGNLKYSREGNLNTPSTVGHFKHKIPLDFKIIKINVNFNFVYI